MKPILFRLIDDLQSCFPLVIETVAWDGFRLDLSGKAWSFHTMAPWRIVTSDRLIQGSEEVTEEKVQRMLMGKEIKTIKSAGSPDIDPVFVLHPGWCLQVFSIHPLEPWTIVTPAGHFFAGEPSVGATH